MKKDKPKVTKPIRGQKVFLKRRRWFLSYLVDQALVQPGQPNEFQNQYVSSDVESWNDLSSPANSHQCCQKCDRFRIKFTFFNLHEQLIPPNS